MKQLYALLNEVERKAAKAMDVRNSYIANITVGELGQLAEVLEFRHVNHSESDRGSMNALTELFLRNEASI